MSDQPTRNLPRSGQPTIKKLSQTSPLGQPPSDPMAWTPPPLNKLEDTGLNLLNLADLVLKVLYLGGVMAGHEISEIVKLPYVGVLETIMEFLKREKYVEVRGSGGFGESSYQYVISGKGSEKAREATERSQYAGPAPVTLNTYVASQRAQNRERLIVHEEELRGVMQHLVISDEMLGRIGPAVNSGRSIFLYGPPGNGKTTVAETIGRMILGDDVWIPYAIDIDGQVIRVFDSVNHQLSEKEARVKHGTGLITDPRWVRIRRPMIMVGGELTMDGLDLIYDPINKFYEAPFQMKANGGLFFIDDFGRQAMRPQDLLNRWIVPLESRIDFLTLNTGRKIELPFNVLIFFSTNLDPKQLVDEAFLRRIPYKIHIGDPTFDQFREIFVNVAKAKKVPYDENGLKYLIQEWYLKKDRPLRCVHPRDILDQLLDMARYLNKPPQMTKELLDHAASAYFVDLGQYTAMTRN